MDAYRFTLSQVSQMIRENKLSPTILVDSLLRRIDELEPKLRAWVTICRDDAKATADKYSKEVEEGRLRGILHGIPIGVKDIFYTKNMKTTCGSVIFHDFVPTYNSTVVNRLKEAGAIILGKTETTEFACFDPAPTRNPWNIDHTPGGSSSGSAAAVSSGMCPAALGSQTGGSTIRPAAYCAIVGLKPTYGRISRYGMYPVSWSLDHVGIFTRTVKDAAILLEVLAGPDPMDVTSTKLPVASYKDVTHNIDPPRLGFLKEFFHAKATEEVRSNLDKIIKQLVKSGAEITECKLPKSFNVVHAAHRILMITEAARIHNETFQTRMRDYRPNLRGMIASGLLTPASIYLKAQIIRSQFMKEMAVLLNSFDGLIMPATNSPAPKGLDSTGDPLFNVPWSFCGYPSITIPSGLTKNRLPLGIQLVTRPYSEARLFNIARWCEKIIRFGHKPTDPV